MAETIRLRTMARKSVFYGGKYDGVSVQQLLDLRNYAVLRWYYYNYAQISYLPDILDELSITEEWRIGKPGADPAKYEQLKEAQENRYNSMLARISEDDQTKACSIYKLRKRRETAFAKGRMKQVMNADRVNFSKANMQRRNHGH